MRRLLSGLVLCCSFVTAAHSQAILGTYSTSATQNRGTQVTLVLTKDAQGKVSGSLTGNGVSYAVQAEMRGDDVAGLLIGGGLRSFFEAHREGGQLRMIMADMGADGKPDYAKAQEIVLAAAGTAPLASTSPVPSTSGNPLARGSAVDKFAGTFTSTDVTLTLTKGGAGYTGIIKYRGADYPVTTFASGETLAGSFRVGAQNYELSIASAGDGKFVNLTTGGTTYMLARSGSSDGNPLAGGGNANPLAAAATAPAAGAGTNLGVTPQDQQIVKLLLSTAWCSFSYSGTSNGLSGTTRSSRTVFRPDGVVVESQGTETSNSGPAGSVVGGNTSGQQARWKIDNGQLMLSGNGVQWVVQPTKLADNGNGYPILTSGGKEYMMCK